MAITRKLWPLALTLCCGACVTVGEPVLVPQSIAKGQRTILLVYPAPAPWVITDSESKAEAAAKMLPVLGYAVSSFQNDRYKAAADTLNKYIPRWPSRDLLEAALLKELPKTDFPGRFIPVTEADPDTTTLHGWNRSTDVLDWQNRYLHADPNTPHPRDYSSVLPWDDALALEVNLLPLLAADDDGNMIPTLTATSRLFRCQTMHPLWKHEDSVEDKSNARSLYEFETLPQQLLDRWKGLVPALALKISSSLYGGLHPGLTAPSAPAPSRPGPTISSPTIASPILPTLSSGTVPSQAPTVSTTTVAVPIGDAPPAPQPPPSAIPAGPSMPPEPKP